MSAETTPNGDVLVIAFDDVRRFVQAEPALRAIRAHHRGAPVAMICGPELEALAAACPHIDDIEVLMEDPEPWVIKRIAKRVKKAKFERIYDLEHSQATDRLFSAMRPGAPKWSGPARGAKFRGPRADGRSSHPIDAFCEQARAAGAECAKAVPDLSWAATARGRAPSFQPEFFNLTEPYALLAPALAAPGEEPRWPASRFAAVAARLLADGYGVGVIAESGDRAAARAVLDANPDAKDLTSRADLAQIAALASRAAIGVGHGSLAMAHLFAAAGAPTIYLRWGEVEREGFEMADDPRHPRALRVMARGPEAISAADMNTLVRQWLHANSVEAPAADERLSA